MEKHIQQHWQELAERSPQWRDAEAAFAAAVRLLVACARSGGKILLCGNGGSAADAEHIAGELMKGFLLPRPLPESWLRRAEEEFPGHGSALRAPAMRPSPPCRWFPAWPCPRPLPTM